MSDTSAFPDGFLWGAATASYQIEGAVRVDGRGESIWDRFSHTPGKIVDGDTGDIAVDHYHRWRDDIGVMNELGLNAYRFSIAWPRIVPGGWGAVNKAGVDFYDRLVDGLLAQGIQPWATLYHWDLPQVLEDAGGWRNRQTIEAFAEFADAITRRLGDRVKHWITINEPWVAAYIGHYLGFLAPGLKDLTAANAVAHHLLVAHGRAVEVVRGNVAEAKTGISLNLGQVYPASDSQADEEAARLVDGQTNRWYLDALYRGEYPEDVVQSLGETMPEIAEDDFAQITRPTDFLGINSYAPNHVAYDPNSPTKTRMVKPDGEYTTVGWLVQPEALQELLVRVHREYAPGDIFITENGAAFDDPAPDEGRVSDPRRRAYLHDHLTACTHAIRDGVPLQGYFVWSLLDNFEWAHGYSKRFGVTYVDYATQERTIKDSGRWYAEVTRANRVVPIPR